MTVGIVVLNWNNAMDTIECLDSVLRTRWRDYILYLVDNGSSDGSAVALESQIRAIADSRQRTLLMADGDDWSSLECSSSGGFVYLRNRSNLGYAGGNNVGIRRAFADGCSGVWILNNDTKVDPHALEAILDASSPGDGVVGLCVLDFENEDRIQCVGGGFYNWWLTRARLNGAGLPSSCVAKVLAKQVDFISGSCMYLPRETLEVVGLLDERYFLYCEEVDFAERCRSQGRPLVIAVRGRIWHRFGSSAGTNRSHGGKSPLAVFHSVRSRLLLTRKHRPRLVPVVAAMRAAYALSFIAHGHPELTCAAFRGLLAGLSDRPDVPAFRAETAPSRI